MTTRERGTRVGVVLGIQKSWWAVAAVLILLVTIAGLVLPASASAQDCPDVDLSFARGRKEPVGVGRVGDAFVESLTPRVQTAGLSMNVYPVNYDAGIFSAGGGANDMSGHLQKVATDCPRTKLIIGGYSMGAEVVDTVLGVPNIGLGFNKPLPNDVGDRIVAIATFGNAVHRTGGSLGAVSPPYGNRVIDLCNQGDPICMAGPNNSWDAHTSYERTGLPDQAAAYVAGKLNRHGVEPSS